MTILACLLGACGFGGGGEPAVADSAAVSAPIDSLTAATPDTATAAADSAAVPDTAQASPAPSPQDATLREVRALGVRIDSLSAQQSRILDRLAVADTVGPAPDSVGAAGDTQVELRNLGRRAVLSVIVIILAIFVIRPMAFVLDALAERNADRRLFYKRLIPLGRLFFWGIAAWIILAVVWGVGAQGLVTAGAAGAVVIGFAAQDILKNAFGGLVIVADRPFAAGDKVKVGDTYGEVVSVGLWSTRITTPDDSLVTVPNSQIVSGQVSNANAGALDCQVVTDLYLPGWVNERVAKKIAYEATASSPYVFLKKPIVVLVRDQLRETFVTNIRVKAYVLDQRYEFLFMSDITQRAREEFRRHGLLGPYHGAHAFFQVPPPPGQDGGVRGDDGDAFREAGSSHDDPGGEGP